MTSLEQQLKRLAVPQTQALLGDQRQRASLLFDRSEAATIGRDEVYAIGINGLQELENIDPSFHVYEKTLFGEASQTFERMHQSKATNEALDKTIGEFLIKLSPYFLLRAATKALEWLIYRYYIHLNNVDEILCAIFPYYNTPSFAKVIQTFRIEKKTGRWYWLSPLKESGASLARNALLNQCIKDPNLLDFLCTMIPKHIEVFGEDSVKGSKNAINFFTSTIVGCLQLGKIKETTVSTLLPNLLGGLKSKSVDYKASSFVILSQIASGVNLDTTLLHKLMAAMTKYPGTQNKEMLMTLLVICQNQNIDTLQKRTFKHLCRIPGIVEHLDMLSADYKTEKLLKPFLKRLIPYAIRDASSLASSSEGEDSDSGHGRPEYMRLLQSILSEIRFADSVALHVAEVLAEQYEALKTSSAPETSLETVKLVFTSIEKKYPNIMDRLTQKLGSESLRDLMAASRHNLVIGLNDASADMRRMAVEKLGEAKPTEEETTEGAVLARLGDDSPVVVEAVLKLANLMDLVSRDALVQKLLELMDRKRNGEEEWKTVEDMAVKHLLACWSELEDELWWQTYSRLMPFIIATEDHAPIIEAIYKSKVASNDDVLKGVAKSRAKKHETVGRNFCNLLRNQPEEYREKLLKTLLSLTKEENCAQVYEPVALRLLSAMVNLIEDTVTRLRYSRLLLDLITGKMLKLKDALEEDALDRSVLLFDNDSSLVAGALSSILSKLKCPQALQQTDTAWWDPAKGEEERLFVFLSLDLLKLLGSYMSEKSIAGDVCRKAASLLSNSYLSTPMAYFNLMSAVFSGHEAMTPVYQLQALYYAKTVLVNATSQTKDSALSSKNSTVPCLLIALNSEYQPLREASCALMADLVASAKAQPYRGLCQCLLKVRGELIASGEYLPQALSAIYDRLSETPKRRTSSAEESQQLQTALNDLVELIMYEDCSCYIKEALLTSLSLVQQKSMVEKLLPLLNALLKKLDPNGLNEYETRCIHLLVQRFTPEIACLFVECEMAKEVFYACLRAGKGHHDSYMSVQRLTLKQLTKEFYEALPTDELRHSMLAHLFDIWVQNEHADVNKSFSKKIKSLPLNVEHISQELRRLLPDTFETVKDTRRVRRRSLEPQLEKDVESIFETKPWKRALLVLETVQNKKKIAGVHQLTKDLFALLKFALQQENQTSADYFKQLILSCLMVIYQSLLEGQAPTQEELKAQGTELNVELIIQCIRTSNNSQTYHHALMLLSTAVSLEPERVLHNIMPIFTFMGDSIVRQDDSYSFKVLTDTIDSIIPALLEASPDDSASKPSPYLEKLKMTSGLASSVKHILQVFVDAYPHIPQHRRLPLFEKLMENLNPGKFLWLLMVLMLDAHTVKHRGKTDDEPHEEKVDEFCLQLCDSFSTQAKIGTAYKLLLYINVELKDCEKKDDNVKAPKSKSKITYPLLDFTNYKLKEVKVLKYSMVGLIAQLLSGASTRSSEGKKAKKLVKTYEQTMEECLLLITDIGRTLSQETNNYWQALLTGSYKILDELQALLKDEVFITVVSGLIKNELPIIRKKTMELLATKLSSPKFKCDPDQIESYLSLLPLLAKSARSVGATGANGATVANRQAALLALRAMCRCFGAQNPGQFQQLLPLVSKLIGEEAPAGVTSSAVVLLAELVTCLRAHSVSSLSSFMPSMIQILERYRNEPSSDTVLPNTVAALQKIVEVLPNFISPYLYQLLANVVRLSSRFTDQDANQKMHMAYRLLHIRKHLSKNIPTRVFLPSLTNCYKELTDSKEWKSIQPIMTTLADHIGIMTSEDVGNYNQSMMTLFLTALNFRVEHADLTSDEVSRVENDVNEAFAALVMKLSESTFRPLFYRLYDWATNEEAPKDRLLSFYRLCDCLASKMKNLFTKFAGHIIGNVALLLDANNTVKSDEEFFSGDQCTEKSSLLLSTIFDVLYKCFLYDNEGFVTKERFDTLMPPLVLQLENMQGGVEVYQVRVSDHLVRCLVQLAVAAGDDGSWKPLNYQVCLKTRDANATVRFASLQVVESLHDKLGTDYMSLLPETIQFLAELAEDENNEVEQKCHDVIKQMEKTLGEPLSKYF